MQAGHSPLKVFLPKKKKCQQNILKITGSRHLLDKSWVMFKSTRPSRVERLHWFTESVKLWGRGSRRGRNFIFFSSLEAVFQPQAHHEHAPATTPQRVPVCWVLTVSPWEGTIGILAIGPRHLRIGLTATLSSWNMQKLIYFSSAGTSHGLNLKKCRH